MYKWAFIETEKKRKELSIKHLGLMKEHSALSDENIAIMNKNISMETDSQSTAKAFKDIRESMTCVICLDIFDDEKAAMIGSCGHVLHQECLQNQQPAKRDVCPSCRKKKPWQKFSGYTGIATALKNLETEGGAQ
jgi:rRNA maturation endonuclease Nob1